MPSQFKQDNPGCDCCGTPECEDPECDCGTSGCLNSFEFKIIDVTSSIPSGAPAGCSCEGYFLLTGSPKWFQYDCVNEVKGSGQPFDVSGESGMWVTMYAQGPAIAFCNDEMIIYVAIWCKLEIDVSLVTITVQVDYERILSPSGVSSKQWARFVWELPVEDGQCPDFSGTEYTPTSVSYSGTGIDLCDLQAADAVLR